MSDEAFLAAPDSGRADHQHGQRRDHTRGQQPLTFRRTTGKRQCGHGDVAVGDDHRRFLRFGRFGNGHLVAVGKILISESVLVGCVPQAAQASFRNGVGLLLTGRNHHVGSPVAVVVSLQRDGLVDVVAALDIHRDALRLVAVALPLLFDMQGGGDHLNHRMRVRVIRAGVRHIVGRISQTCGLVRVEARLSGRRGVAVKIGAFVANRVAIAVGRILVVCLLGRLHVIGKRVGNTVAQRVQEHDRELLGGAVVGQHVVTILFESDLVAVGVLRRHRVVLVGEFDIFGKRIFDAHAGETVSGGFFLLDFFEDLVQSFGIGCGLVVAFVSTFAQIERCAPIRVFSRGLRIVVGNRVQELVDILRGVRRISAVDNTDAVYRFSGILEFLRRRYCIRRDRVLERHTGGCLRLAIREEDNHLLDFQ